MDILNTVSWKSTALMPKACDAELFSVMRYFAN